MQVNNECAIEFYRKFGFEIVETRDQYYKRIEPAGAHILEKNLRQTKTTDGQTNCNSQSSTAVAATTNASPPNCKTNTPANAVTKSQLPNGVETHSSNSNQNHQQTKSKVAA